MGAYESFDECLQRVLDEQHISASEAARLAGFRSRNSIFRILNGETSAEVDGRFLRALQQAVGEIWPQRHWTALKTALNIKRVGLRQYQCEQAFLHAMGEGARECHYVAETQRDGAVVEMPLEALLREICARGKISMIICGCSQRDLAALLSFCLNDAGSEGRLKVRHYIDISRDALVSGILGAMPLLSRVWYNARLVEERNCSKEMAAIYQLNVISIAGEMPDGSTFAHQLLQCEADRFIHMVTDDTGLKLHQVLDRCRFQFMALKPLFQPSSGTADFVAFTARYARLEKDSLILSIKPDVHFNLVPTQMIYQAVVDGFAQSGMASGEGLAALAAGLQSIHDERVANMYGKRRPTHLVYSLPAMEQFMRTGVLTDHFFIQRAYTVEERRAVLSGMLRQMQKDPFFNIYFLRDEKMEIKCEMTLYGRKGVLLMDAHTGYDLHDDHSEALIDLPDFMQSFQRFFMDVLLEGMVMSRSESLAVLERLIAM